MIRFLFNIINFLPYYFFLLAIWASKAKKSKAPSVPSQVEVEDVDSSDDETWVAGVSTAFDQEAEEAAEEEFIDLEVPSEGELEGEDDDEEEDSEDEVAGLSSNLGKMSVTRSANDYSLGFTYPTLIYDYMDDRQKMITIDILVQTLEPDHFSVKFNEAGTEIHVSTRLPDFFACANRLTMIDTKLTSNSSKVVAFEKCITKLGVDTDHEEDIFGPPQKIKLPFKCDTKIPIEPEPQFFESWGINTGNPGDVTAQQYYMVLMIELEAAEKPRRVVRQKQMKVFGTPKK